MKKDIIIIGGGIIGSAIAYFLSRTGRAGEIAVIEPDPTYERAATPKAGGGIRRLFSLPENIAMGAYGLEFFEAFEQAMAIDGDTQPISFRRQGYLFISDDGGHAKMEANHAIQVAHGVDAELLDAVALKALFPSLNTDDIACAVYSPTDGWIDPQSALSGFRRKARSLGVEYVQDRVVGWRRENGIARDITLSSGETFTADAFVLCCGAWSAEVGAMVGLDLPVAPLSRESHFFKTKAEIEPLPFLKSESELAFRPEGQGYDGGSPDWSREPGWNFEMSQDWFETVVWPKLAHRIPAMETLKLERTRVGHYAYSLLDKTAIIGRWEGDGVNGCDNVYMATGYSGHGIMHSPATGLALSELILDGNYSTLDITAFGYARVAANKPYRESGIV